METNMKGKCALITGGASGIGLGISLALANEGVNLIIASRKPDQKAVEAVQRYGVQCKPIRVDVSDEAQVVEMVQTAIGDFRRVDYYINNAAWTWHQPVTRLRSEDWYATLNTNLSACVWACREISHHMIENHNGSILIIGSTARFNPAYTEAAYRISKVGLKSYMENLAIELAPFGIRVNMVTPGHFRTRMTSGVGREREERMRRIIPLHDFGEPGDIGRAAAFLLSDSLSRYTTGADLVIDGGLVLRPLPMFSESEIEEMNS